MDGQTSGTNETMDNQAQVDPWIAAFAALEQGSQEDTSEDSNMGNADNSGTPDNPEGTSGEELPNNDEAIDSTASEGNLGGFGADAGSTDEEGGSTFSSMYGLTEESIQQYEQELEEQIRDRAMREIADEFVKHGVRNTNGVLGATINDPDIRKRDEDGVSHYYNPETGAEFLGELPRLDAQKWVDLYNEDLKRVYNDACEQYEQHLRKEIEPQIAVRRFAPKYEKLDPIRRGMFDNAIEEYEIRDKDDKVIGYNCDLDKKLALVDRQISMIQNYAKQHQPQQQQQPTGPVLDMKTSSGAVPSGEQGMPASLAEAMEHIQDKKLAELNR